MTEEKEKGKGKSRITYVSPKLREAVNSIKRGGISK